MAVVVVTNTLGHDVMASILVAFVALKHVHILDHEHHVQSDCQPRRCLRIP